MYAMGWTQHTYGTQNIRTAAIIQLLLGNVGRAGGGINALRGESNVQGSTDHCLLFHILPGYLKPSRAKDETLEAYLEAYTPKSDDPKSANWWQHYPKYAVSLLKWMYGDNATSENEFGYQWLAKLADGGNYSWLALFEAMYAEEIKGFFAWGQNPAVGGANANMNRKAMEKLDWMVVREPVGYGDLQFLAATRCGSHDDSDRSLLLAGGCLSGKGGQCHQLRSVGAVALEGRGSTWRGQGRFLDHQ